MKKILLISSLILLSFAFYARQIKKARADNPVNEVSVTYLGHSGWAVQTSNSFLIFDYQEEYDFNWDKQPERKLISGYINTEEIENLNVYVFISHSHSDHFDPLILTWEKGIDNITYFFGWDFSADPRYHCLKTPHSIYKDKAIEVYTINSHHSGVFESAFLVKIDGITIYHNGDYKGDDYRSDYKYLRSKTEKIDIAFSNSVPIEGTQYLQQTLQLIGECGVKHFFPMHSINKEEEYKLFAKMLENKGARSVIHCAEIKGDKFVVN